jgi:hypothetical protein
VSTPTVQTAAHPRPGHSDHPATSTGRGAQVRIADRFAVGPIDDPQVYEVESLSGPDPQYPIVLRKVGLSCENERLCRQFFDDNHVGAVPDPNFGDFSSPEALRQQWLNRRMEQELRWFLRSDVRRVA